VSGILIAAAVLVAVGAVGVRALLRRREERRRPGATPATAIPAPRFDEIDDTARAQRCRCGRPLRIIGEGPANHPSLRLRFVQLECPACGHERRVYFDVTQAFH
jgi:hypothetical protein